MTTRISGKQTAARITAVVAVGSFAVAGVGFVALEIAPNSDAATTTTSPGENDDSLQAPATRQNDDSAPTRSTSRNNSATQSPQVKKTVVRQGDQSVASPVTKGNGGSFSGNSSGS